MGFWAGNPAGCRPGRRWPGCAGKTIAVQIVVGLLDPDGKRGDITRFLASHGIAHSPVVGNNDIYATVPVSLLTHLAAQPGVRELMALPHPYPNLGTYLNGLVAKYEAGLMPGEDANPTFARLVIGIEGSDNYDAVNRFLEDSGAIMRYDDLDIAEIYKPIGLLVAFVPVAQIAPLASMPGVDQVNDEGYPAPEELRFTQPPLDYPTATPTPTAIPTAATQDAPPDGVTSAAVGVSPAESAGCAAAGPPVY